jgi:hypothetical protein
MKPTFMPFAGLVVVLAPLVIASCSKKDESIAPPLGLSASSQPVATATLAPESPPEATASASAAAPATTTTTTKGDGGTTKSDGGASKSDSGGGTGPYGLPPGIIPSGLPIPPGLVPGSKK